MKKLYFLSFVFLFSSLLTAQNNSFGIYIKAYQPNAAFTENTNAVPVGVSFDFLRQQENSRFSYGIESGFANYGCEEKVIQYQGEEVEIHEDDAFFSLNGIIRYDAASVKGAKLYGEGKAGMNTFFTSTTPVDCESEYKGDLKVHGSSFNLSLGGGLLINPTIFGNYDEQSIWLIDLGANSTVGTTTSYGVPDAEQQGFNKARSLTNFIEYRIGVVINL